MIAKRGDVVIQLQALEAKLDSGAARPGVLHGSILTRVEAIFDDLLQAFGKASLFEDGASLLLGAGEVEVGVDGVFGDGLAHILKSEAGGLESCSGSPDVIFLRVTKDERAGGDAEEGWRPERESVAVTESGG